MGTFTFCCSKGSNGNLQINPWKYYWEKSSKHVWANTKKLGPWKWTWRNWWAYWWCYEFQCRPDSLSYILVDGLASPYFLSIVLHIITILLRCKILFWWYNKIIIFCSNQILFPFCFISNPSSDTSLVNLAKPLPLVIHSNFSICRGYGVGTWKHFFYAENFSYYYCSLKNFQIHSQRTLRHCWNELNQFAA